MEIKYTNIKKCKEGVWQNTYLNLFTEGELNKIRRFKRDKERTVSLISLALQYFVINTVFLKTDVFKKVNIKKTKYGKPYVDNFEYSVSHDNNIVIIVTSFNGPVGIDIMSLNRKIKFDLCKSMFSIKEYEQIKNIKDFLIFWCLKEAYVKAIGLGLSVPFDKIGFEIGDKIKLYFDGIYKPNWHFNYFILQSEYVVAVAQETKFDIQDLVEVRL